MGGRRRVKSKRIKPRNPVAVVVRALTPRVKASAKTYTRKPKHKRRGWDDAEPNS